MRGDGIKTVRCRFDPYPVYHIRTSVLKRGCMSKLSLEVRSLNEDEYMRVLNNVNYKDLQREFWVLSKEKTETVVENVFLPTKKKAKR